MIEIKVLLIALAIYLAITFIVWFVKLPTELWKDFQAVMNIMRVRDLAESGQGPEITPWAWRLGVYILMRGYIRDCIVNTFHLSIYLREAPRWPKWSRRGEYESFVDWLLKDGELTVSGRLQRHVDTPDSPHHEECKALQAYWLSQYDPSGRHGTV